MQAATSHLTPCTTLRPWCPRSARPCLDAQVSDEGGGIARSHMPKIWSYLFTTAKPAFEGAGDEFPDSQIATDSPLAGLGYGLPTSRAYARYFGGDLNVMSMEGYGTDAFLHLSRLGNRNEPLP